MKRIMMVMGLLTGLMVGACDAIEFGETAPGSDESDVIRDDDPHLPGSCTNPVACGETPNQNPLGENPAQCSGCDCAPSRTSCRSCVIHCRSDWYRCLGSTGTTREGCDLVYGASCEQNCAPQGTCACPQP